MSERDQQSKTDEINRKRRERRSLKKIQKFFNFQTVEKEKLFKSAIEINEIMTQPTQSGQAVGFGIHRESLVIGTHVEGSSTEYKQVSAGT